MAARLWAWLAACERRRRPRCLRPHRLGGRVPSSECKFPETAVHVCAHVAIFTIRSMRDLDHYEN